MSRIAWAGELELLEAKWTDKDGHLVKFRLVTPNEERPNPFKAFTKRRGKRGGTRFIASLSHVQGMKTDNVMYNGEFMLAGWSDTSTAGYSVTFWCEPPEVGIHSFDGYSRGVDTFMAALVELDENDQPIDQERRDRVEAATAPKAEKGGEKADPATASNARRGPRKLSQYAAMMCGNDEFWDWINKTQLSNSEPRIFSTEQAANWMRSKLGIDSRRDIDTMESKEKMYHELIRKPYAAYMEGETV